MVAEKIIASGEKFTTLKGVWEAYNKNHPDADVDDYFMWKEITALDDWATLATTLAPYIIEYGPKVLSAIYNKLKGKSGVSHNKITDNKGFTV